MSFRQLMLLGALVTALLVNTACTPRSETSWLMLGGDVMLARGGEPIYIESSPWGEVSRYLDEKSADLFAANLESPLGRIDASILPENLDMNLCADESLVAILQQAGIDLVTTANNHSTDCTASKPSNTINTLENAGLLAMDDAYAIRYAPSGEQIVAFVNINAYPGISQLEQYKAALTASRQDSALVVVSIHWGNEYQAGPSREQEQLAQDLVDAGADLVWGHHPHVLQRMEWRTSKVDGHQALVLYSLGNLLSDQWMLPDATRSALIRIRFSAHQVRQIEVIPLQMDASSQTLIFARDSAIQEIMDRLQVFNLREAAPGIKVSVEGGDH